MRAGCGHSWGETLCNTPRASASTGAITPSAVPCPMPSPISHLFHFMARSQSKPTRAEQQFRRIYFPTAPVFFCACYFKRQISFRFFCAGFYNNTRQVFFAPGFSRKIFAQIQDVLRARSFSRQTFYAPDLFLRARITRKDSTQNIYARLSRRQKYCELRGF